MHTHLVSDGASSRAARAHLARSPALAVNIDNERSCRLQDFALVVRLGRHRLRMEASLERCGTMGQAGTHLDELGFRLGRHISVAKLICPAQVRMLYVGRLQMLSFGLFGGHLGIVCILRGGAQSLGI